MATFEFRPADVRTARELGGLVRLRRNELGLTQAQVAKLVKVSRQWIVSVEAGDSRAELPLVIRLVRTLGLRICLDVEAQDTANGPNDIDLDKVLRDATKGSF